MLRISVGIGPKAWSRESSCLKYRSCLRRAAQENRDFSCTGCPLLEIRDETPTEKIIESLRAAALWLEVFPELADQDPLAHEGLNTALDLPHYPGEVEDAMSRISVAAEGS